MSSAFNDSASESKIEQALAECAALTRANDARRALNAGRMIETAHMGQPRVLARVARMYSDLGMQDESARVLRGLQSSVRPSAVSRRDDFDASELPSYGADDDEPTQAKSFQEIMAGGLPGVPTLVASVPPPPRRAGAASAAPASPAQPPSSSVRPLPTSSSAPPPPVRSAAPAPLGPPARPPPSARPSSSAPPPPPRGAGPPVSGPPPPPPRGAGSPVSSVPPPPAPGIKPVASSVRPPPAVGLKPVGSVPPPPPPGGKPVASSVPPPPGRAWPGVSSAPAPPLKPRSEPASFPPPGGLKLPPPPGIDGPEVEVSQGEWDFDEDDDEPTRAFTPGLVGRSGPPVAAGRPAPEAPGAASSAPPAAGAGWRDRVQVIRSKTVESFEQLKKKSGDQLRKISSRPPPPAASAAPAPAPTRPTASAVEAEVAEFKRGGLAARLPRKSRVTLLAALLLGTAGIVFWHGQTRQHQESLENELEQARPLLWSSDVSEVKKISEHLDHSFGVTSYGSLANGVAGALGLSDGPVFESLEPEAHVLALRQHAVLRLLDPQTRAAELEPLLDAVQEADVAPERIRFAKLLPALEAKPEDVREADKLDAALAKDPVALLMSGILLERVGKVDEAAQRYQAAAEQQRDWHLPKLYAARLTLLTQGAEAAKPELEALREAARVDPNLGVPSRALNALSWVVDSGRSRELPDTAKLAAPEQASLPPVLSQVPELVKLVEAMLEEDDALKERLSTAIRQADGPALLVELAGFAASVNQDELVDDAIDRVQEFAKGYAPAKALAAQMQLSKGDFAAARQTAKAAGLDTSGIDAVEAYELQDAKNLRRALESMPQAEKKKPEYAAVLAADEVLSGAEYPSSSEIAGFLKANSLWGEFIAVDAALDQGDLDRARAVIKEWPENERSALHLIRVARYERYKGRTRDAVSLSKKALEQASTSSRALIEHLLALIADERLADAVKLYSDALYKDMLKPHERWMDALLVGKDKGWMAANVITSYLQPPSREEALSLRLLALRAMSVAGDPRAGLHLKRMGDELPQNPDYLTSKAEY